MPLLVHEATHTHQPSVTTENAHAAEEYPAYLAQGYAAQYFLVSNMQLKYYSGYALQADPAHGNNAPVSLWNPFWNQPWSTVDILQVREDNARRAARADALRDCEVFGCTK